MERIAIVLGGVLLFITAIFIQVSVWNECRTDHSFFYCMSVLSHK